MMRSWCLGPALFRKHLARPGRIPALVSDGIISENFCPTIAALFCSSSSSKETEFMRDALRTSPMIDRKTKIVCTIGPKSSDHDSVNALLHAGMNVLRLNCSHGDHAFYRQVIDNLSDCLAKVSEPGVAIDFSDGAREDTYVIMHRSYMCT